MLSQRKSTKRTANADDSLKARAGKPGGVPALGLLALGALLLFLMVLAVAPSAQAACLTAPRTFEIDDDYPAANPAACQYQNINQTMAVGPLWGDTYIIHNGTYYLNYVLTVGGTTWIGDSQSGVIVRRAATGSAPYGALETRGSYTNISFMTFESNSWALVVDYNSGESGSSNNRITNLTLNAVNGYGCVCWGDNLVAINITANSFYGVHLYSDNPVVRNFRFNGVGNGVGLPLYAQNFSVDGVQLSGSFSTGLESYSAYGTLANFTSSGGYYGIYMDSMAGPVRLFNVNISNASDTGIYASYVQVFVDGLRVNRTGNFGVYHYGGGVSTPSNFTNVSVTNSNVGFYFDWQSIVNLRNIYADNGQRGLYLYYSRANAFNVTLTNWTWNPIQGEGTSFLNLTQAYLLAGNDDIWWPSDDELWVTDTVLDKSSAGGIAYQSYADLRMTNVSVINQPDYAVSCGPCGTVYWTGGAVDNTRWGLYSQNDPVSYIVSRVAFSNMSSTSLAAYSYPSPGPFVIDNSTFTNVSSAIELVGTQGMLVERG